jgi:hypothetical protein
MCYQTQKYTMYQNDVFVYETSQARLVPGSVRGLLLSSILCMHERCMAFHPEPTDWQFDGSTRDKCSPVLVINLSGLFCCSSPPVPTSSHNSQVSALLGRAVGPKCLSMVGKGP